MIKILLNKDINLKHYVLIPTSKSISNRLLILQYLIKNHLNVTFEINNLAESDDTQILNNVLSTDLNNSSVDVKNAGTCFRFLTSLLSVISGEIILTGSPEMKKRPIKELVDSLTSIGANIKYLEKEGFPPLKIKGSSLEGEKVTVNASISSQYVTAMLLIAPFLKNGLEIEQIGEIKSKSYTQMTISLLKEIGVKVIQKENIIKVESIKNVAIKSIEIEADWSSASYWYEFISLLPKYSKIQINGLKNNSIQGDSLVFDLYKQFGITTYFGENGVEIIKTKEIEDLYFEHDFSSIPDMVPTLVATCVGLGFNGKFTGISHLIYKETNRIEALKNEIMKLNYSLEMINANSFKIIKQGELPSNVTIETYKDHRMAMSFAPLVAKMNKVNIQNPEVVIKSYPSFWEQFC